MPLLRRGRGSADRCCDLVRDMYRAQSIQEVEKIVRMMCEWDAIQVMMPPPLTHRRPLFHFTPVPPTTAALARLSPSVTAPSLRPFRSCASRTAGRRRRAAAGATA